MIDDTFKTLAAPSEGYFMDRRSKFHATAFPVTSEEEIKTHLAALRKKYYDARHHVYAWILGPEKLSFRINDDGEPSGSSAKPIYGQMLSNDLTNVLIVVVRYFGGTKLGVPGLINAYRTAAADAIENGKIVTKILTNVYSLNYDYLKMNDVMKIIKDENLKIIDQQFEMQCRLDLKIRQKETERIVERFRKAGEISIDFVRETF